MKKVLLLLRSHSGPWRHKLVARSISAFGSDVRPPVAAASLGWCPAQFFLQQGRSLWQRGLRVKFSAGSSASPLPFSPLDRLGVLFLQQPSRIGYGVSWPVLNLSACEANTHSICSKSASLAASCLHRHRISCPHPNWMSKQWERMSIRFLVVFLRMSEHRVWCRLWVQLFHLRNQGTPSRIHRNPDKHLNPIRIHILICTGNKTKTSKEINNGSNWLKKSSEITCFGRLASHRRRLHLACQWRSPTSPAPIPPILPIQLLVRMPVVHLQLPKHFVAVPLCVRVFLAWKFYTFLSAISPSGTENK